MTRRRRSSSVSVERLEERRAPALFGIPWPDAGHLSVSFAPDGTDASGTGTTLFQSLDSRVATAAWQGEILRALQTWAVNGNINLSLHDDNGTTFGQAG